MVRLDSHPATITSTIMKVLILLACMFASTMAAPKNELTCTLCTDIITDFVAQICAAIGALISGFEETCNFLIASQLPAIIEGLVNDNLNPTQLCTDVLGACP